MLPIRPKTPGCRSPLHLVKEKFDALEAHVKLAIKYAEVYALDVEKAHEELDEPNSQVAALYKALDHQLKAETSARPAEAAHPRALKVAQKRLDVLNAFTRLNGQCEHDRSRSPSGSYVRRRR